MIEFADVSEWQGAINWPAYDRPIAIARAHNGYRPDNSWPNNRDGMRAHVSVRGWYQFLVPTRTPEDQAHDFIATVGVLLPDEFAVADSEGQPPGTPQWAAGQQVAWTHRWLAVVDAWAKRLSVVYTNLDGFYQGVDAGHPVWIAHPGGDPNVHGEVFLQDGTNVFPGINGQVDRNWYAGPIGAFRNAVGLSPAPSQPAHIVLPSVPAPPPVHFPPFVDQELGTMHKVFVQSEVAGGSGWKLTDIPFDKVISVDKQGAAPQRDNTYWTGEVSINDTGNQLELTFTECKIGIPGSEAIQDGGLVGVYVTVADAPAAVPVAGPPGPVGPAGPPADLTSLKAALHQAGASLTQA